MTTCIDCLYYERCDVVFDGLLSNRDNKPCVQFENKIYYAKLPAYIGQKVWVPHAYWMSLSKTANSAVREGKVSGLQQKADKSWKIRISVNGCVSDYTEEEFNKLVFLSELEAEVERKRLVNELEAQYGL